MEHLPWYTIHTKPHKERQVAAVLQERQMQVFLPTLPAPRREHPSATRAFFPCYLFAQVDLPTVGLWPLHYAPGVRGVVMFGGMPAQVDEQIIAALRQRLAQMNAPASAAGPGMVDAFGRTIEPGDRVVITTGPLAELEAVFDQRLSAAGRVRVLIQFLQRWKPVELEAKSLRKAGMGGIVG